MKIKDGFIVNEIAGKSIVVAIGERSKEFNGMITLNVTALEMWKLLQNEMTEEQLVTEMITKFDGEEQFIRQDVHRFVEKLRENKLLDA